MTIILKSISLIGLVLTLFPSFLVLDGSIDLALNKNLMMLGTAMWFLTVPFWINKQKDRT